jgi:queuine tRNA-ribosyltransferase
MKFTVHKKAVNKAGNKARVGTIHTPHGDIETPAFTVVGTKATVKGITPEMLKSIGTQAVLANTYHLYLQPGPELVEKGGGFGKFMGWNGPTLTDSGGFQVFSLGVAYGKGISKISGVEKKTDKKPLAKIDEEGVTFKSILEGSLHRFTPEKSMEIQHALGADIFFAFDECTSPSASHQYQQEAMDRTHRWAERCVKYHNANNKKDQALFAVVQGGRFEDLRRESARTLAAMDFAGFGIGGSFDKEDIGTAVGWVTDELPENKPRHLLGIGEPLDIFLGVEQGIDTFDCVIPTRIGRHGNIFTKNGKVNILNKQYRDNFDLMIEGYPVAYVAHLFRAKEMLGLTLASLHNIRFIVGLVADIRAAMVEDRYEEFKADFLASYKD